MDFKVGDNVYKLKYDVKESTIDKSILYKIKEISVEHGGNWHDGFSTTWNAVIVPADIYCSICTTEDHLIIRHKIWGFDTQDYIVLAE